MPKTKPRGHQLGARVEGQLHVGRSTEPTSDPVRLLIQDAQSSPAWPFIVAAFGRLALLGIDRSDPDIVRRVIQSGQRDYEHDLGLKPRPVGRHEPIIYYMALGDLVKVGTSRNLAGRLNDLNPQSILAVERGGPREEKQRHALFDGLRVHGEWFRYEDPLMSYIHAVGAAFEADFGTPLNAWLTSVGASR